MRLPLLHIILGLALGVGVGCGSVTSTSDGGGTGGSATGQGGTGGTSATGLGGTGGHGGATGSGGGSGGRAGSSGGKGSGGAGGASCDALATQYADALPAAQSCALKASGECQQLVSSSLSPCFLNCETYVNDPSTLNAIKASWEQAGCDSLVGTACPAIACLQPTNNVCSVGDGGSGTCSSNSGSAGGSGGHGGAAGGAGGSVGGTGGHGGSSGGGGKGGAGSGGTVGSGGNSGTDGGMTCSPSCTSGFICVASGTEGGAIINANDAGVCPSGTHPTGFESRCENDLAYGCMPVPAACGGTVTCTCAATLCRAPEICMGPTSGVLSCILEAP